MIETLSPHRARGRISIPAKFGSAQFGEPFSEPGHITPRFPEGISNTALSSASMEIQRETALCWFHMNLILWDQMKGGPYLGFASEDGTYGPNLAGFGVGVFAPPRYDAISVLTAEFGGTLPEPLLAELANELPGQWEWPDPPPREDHQPEDLPQSIWDELQRLKQQMATMQAVRGGIGHNNPPADDGEAFDPSAAIEDLQNEVKAPQPDKATIWKKWLPIAACVGGVTLFLTHGAADKMSSEMWEHAHAAALAWETAHHVGGLIARITGFL